MDNKQTQYAVEQWRGRFGAEYITRNQATTDAVNQATEVFRRIICNTGIDREVESILEVGANVGINLRGLRNLLGDRLKIAALEPNTNAVEILKTATDLNLAQVIESTCYEIPAPDNSFDLVFTRIAVETRFRPKISCCLSEPEGRGLWVHLARRVPSV